MKVPSHQITIALMCLVFVSIIWSDFFSIDKLDWPKLIITFIFALAAGGVILSNSGLETPSKVQLFLLGIYTILVIGYTIYQWYQLAGKNDDECGMLLPHTDNFNSGQYYLYRIIYLTTLIVLVSLLQFKVDNNDFKIPGPISLHYFLFLMPLILPMLTELVDGIINDFGEGMGITEHISNPESLLANIFLGDASKMPEDWWKKIKVMIIPTMFYLLLMFVTIDSSYGITSFWGSKGNTAIYITLFIVVFFTFIMRTIFIQDCSLAESKNISKVKAEGLEKRFPCKFEKYGGLQTLMCISLIILVIYHLKNPIYKILFFLIICLGSWGLSTTYMLTMEN